MIQALKVAAAIIAGTSPAAAVAPAVQPTAQNSVKSAMPASSEATKSMNDFARSSAQAADRASLPGAPLWEGNCAMCHSGSVAEAPHLQWLEMMPSTAIVKALTTGVMAEQGSALSETEKLQIAEYVTRK